MGKHIGVFDSGIGGLSVLAEIYRKDPELTFSYIADTAFNPYGNKTEKQIIQRSHYLTQQLLNKGADLIVVACNTATAFAIEELRKHYQVPIVAMEPAIKPAAEQSQTGKVLIMATTMTLSSDRYYHLLERFAEQSQFIHQACPGLVEIVENMEVEKPEAKQLIHQYVQPALENDIDSIVLGCTHYPFMKDIIRELVGDHISIIETSEAVSRQVVKKLQTITTIKKPVEKFPEQNFYTTGSLEHFKSQVAYYWINPINKVIIKAMKESSKH